MYSKKAEWGIAFIIRHGLRPRRRYDVKPLSALLAVCEENPPATGGFPSQRVSNAEHYFSLAVSTAVICQLGNMFITTPLHNKVKVGHLKLYDTLVWGYELLIQCAVLYCLKTIWHPHYISCHMHMTLFWFVLFCLYRSLSRGYRPLNGLQCFAKDERAPRL